MQSCRFLAIVTAVGLAACTGTGQPNSPASDFAHYRSLPNYRAMAVSGGAYALGDLPFTVIDGNPFRL